MAERPIMWSRDNVILVWILLAEGSPPHDHDDTYKAERGLQRRSAFYFCPTATPYNKTFQDDCVSQILFRPVFPQKTQANLPSDDIKSSM